MLRVGLTGGLGSGKSTVARMLAEHGAHVLSSDEIGRELMQPGQAVFDAVVAHFGPEVLASDGTLNRPALARIAFDPVHPERLKELNAIVHPGVIAEQQRRAAEIATREPGAVIVAESALIFETRHAGPDGWHHRFDRILLVTAPDDLKIARFLTRTPNYASLTPSQRDDLAAEARRRLAQQIPDAQKAAHADYILSNDGPLEDLQRQVDTLWPGLLAEAARSA